MARSQWEACDQAWTVIEDVFTRQGSVGCWDARRAFIRLQGELVAIARQEGDRQFGHGWREGYERGRQDGAAAQEARAQTEISRRDGIIAALRSQLTMAQSEHVIPAIEEPSEDTLQALEIRALFARHYHGEDPPTH